MRKEEEILFPNIRQLMKNRRVSGAANFTTFGLIKDAVRSMQKEHNATMEDMKTLRKLTNDYKPPEDAGKTYRYLLKKMQEFENDLLVHVHLERDILFPKAIALDETIG